MQFLFRRGRRQQELDELNRRILELQREIGRLEQLITPSLDEEGGETYRSVRRLREAMLKDELAAKRAELAQLTERAADLQAQLPRPRARAAPAAATSPGPPTHPPAEPARPAAPAAPAPPAPAASQTAGPPAAAAAPKPPPPVAPPAAPPEPPPAPLARPAARLPDTDGAGARAVPAPGAAAPTPPSPRRSVETAVGWPGARWLFMGCAILGLAIWLLGALLSTGMPPSLLWERTTAALGSSLAALPRPAAARGPAVAEAERPRVTPAGPTAVGTPLSGAAVSDSGASLQGPARAMVWSPPAYSGALLRSEPSLRAPSHRYLPNGAIIQVLDGSSSADGYQWRRVRTADGAEGWVVSQTIRL